MAASAQNAEAHRLCGELSHHVHESHHYDKAVGVCDQILAIVPNDTDILTYKALSLIHSDQFAAAASLLDGGAEWQRRLSFEKAYALYKLERLDEAHAICKGASESDPRMLQLEAQICYRRENYTDAVQLYEKLKSSGKFQGEESELNTNLMAAEIGAGRVTRTVTTGEAYEEKFNAACLRILAGDLAQAAQLLQEAEDTCRQTLGDGGMTVEEIENEVAVVRVQRAYLAQLQGRPTDAQTVYNEVQAQKPSDQAVMTVVANNLAVIYGEGEHFAASKKFEKITEARLLTRQRRVLAMNRCIVNLMMNKLDAARSFARAFNDQFPGSALPALIEAATWFRDRKISKAQDVLNAWLAANPRAQDTTLVQLSLAQIQFSEKSTHEALVTLQSAPELLHQPGVVRAMAAQYEAQGQADEARTALDAAIVWWSARKGSAEAAEGLNKVLNIAAGTFFRMRQYAQASAVYKKLLEISPNNKTYQAALVLAAAHVNPKEAEQAAKSLPTVTAAGDVAALEKAPPATVRSWQSRKGKEEDGAAAAAAAGAAGKAPEGEPVKSTKDKKKRKKKNRKLPKNYDPNRTPNPERWLPKKERSDYRKPKNKKKQSRGVQGGQSEKEASKLQKEKAEAPVESAAASPPPSNKKKGKGRR